MKETRQVSIGGYAFVLETDAAAELRNYLDALGKHYSATEGGREVLEGIEERIAELLMDKRANVISNLHVQEVINVIGRPESIEADDPGDGGEPVPPARKKLFRDMENKRLGGVCSGLATYLNMDVAFMRLIWVVVAAVTIFTGVKGGAWSISVPFFYFVLWAAMPAARTARDRWAMKGDSGTINDIRRNVRSGVREMGEAARGVAEEAKSSDLLRGIGKVMAVTIGLIILIVGVAGLASSSIVALKGFDMFGFNLGEWLDNITINLPGVLTFISEPFAVIMLALAVLLPFLWLLYGGIQLIFGFKSPSWRPGACILVAWLIVLVVLMVLGFAGMITFSNPIEIA